METIKHKIEVSGDIDYLMIKIDDLLHLKLSFATPLISIQSWKDYSTGYYCIEYKSATQPTLSEYTDKEIWKEILRGLEKIEF